MHRAGKSGARTIAPEGRFRGPRFWRIDATTRSESSDLTARLRLIRQNGWHGLARVNQTQRTWSRWSGIKRIMISVDRAPSQSAIPVRCVVALRSVRFPQVSRAASAHPNTARWLETSSWRGNPPRANYLTKLRANFTPRRFSASL